MTRMQKGGGRRVCTDSHHLANRRHSCRIECGQAHRQTAPPHPTPTAETDFKLLYCYVTHLDQIL